MEMVYGVFDFAQIMGAVKTGVKTPQATVDLYEKLIHEEYKEFCESKTEENKLNETMDLIWVLIGYAITRDWDIPGAWQELYRANMAKLVFDDDGNLKRRADGKIQKPDGWKKPNFKKYLNRDNREAI